MINIMSYIGMSMQSELCLWTLLGLIRTIFDATLFKVNANLKQVWQMHMPEELSMPVQRVLRTMISGVMLVQCFTVYVYLATYIVLLYPVFLEERPTLVLPWLLLAAVRKFLCELTCLAIGLGTCVLLGPARPPCIRFLIFKVASIMPAFYMWMLIFSYYHTLKVAAAFKTFPAVLPANDYDYGLELAVRRRCTKSLLGEDQLRRKLVASFYEERHSNAGEETVMRPKLDHSSRMVHSTDTSADDVYKVLDVLQCLSSNSTQVSESGSHDNRFGEIIVPRDTDRILEQFCIMLLRISAYTEKLDCIDIQPLNSATAPPKDRQTSEKLECPAIIEDTETPSQAGNGNKAAYLRDYPQIFMKKTTEVIEEYHDKAGTVRTVKSENETAGRGSMTRSRKRSITINSNDTITLEVEKILSRRKISNEKSISRRKTYNKSKARKKSLYEEKTNQKDDQSDRSTLSPSLANSSQQVESEDKTEPIIAEITTNHLPQNNESSKEDVRIDVVNDATSTRLLDQAELKSKSTSTLPEKLEDEHKHKKKQI